MSKKQKEIINEFQKKVNATPSLPYLSKALARDILITQGIIKPRRALKIVTVFPPDVVFGETSSI